MLYESFGLWSANPSRFEYTPKLVNDLFWSNFSTFAEAKTWDIGFDDPNKVALATAGTKIIEATPGILSSAAQNLYHAIEGEPTNWADTGWALVNAVMDGLVAYVKAYASEETPRSRTALSRSRC